MKKLLAGFVFALIASHSQICYALTFSDDMTGYAEHEFINGKNLWISTDTYYGKGWWLETTAAPGPWIQFHPSPWPGGFPLGSNRATFHVTSPHDIVSLALDLTYFVMPRSDMQVFLSADNLNWVDISGDLGVQPSPAEPPTIVPAHLDLSAHISPLHILNDVYVKITAAAYSGTGWGVGILNIAVAVNDVIGLDLDPNTLNLSSPGSYVTAYLSMDALITAAQVDVNSLKITKVRFANGHDIPTEIHAIPSFSEYADFDQDGFIDLKVKFDRAAIISTLQGMTGQAELTVTGKTLSGETFTGQDTIRVINRGR